MERTFLQMLPWFTIVAGTVALVLILIVVKRGRMDRLLAVGMLSLCGGLLAGAAGLIAGGPPVNLVLAIAQSVLGLIGVWCLWRYLKRVLHKPAGQ